MKHFFTYFPKAILLIAIAFMLTGNISKACNRSDAVLYSVAYGAGFVDVTITTRIGGGVTGTQKGADAATRTFAYAVYGAATVNYITATPSVTSDTTKVTYPMSVVGPGVVPGTRFAVAYNYVGTDFTCVTSTAACGHLHTDTVTVTIRTNELPDSVRALGIEGAGNPVAGCYPDADMLVDLTSLPVVWAGFEARKQEYGVDLEWTTASESNNDYFIVQRSVNGGTSFEAIGEIDAVGNSTKAINYSFVDGHPATGTNFYKIVQVDRDGSQSESDVQQVVYEAPSGMSWIQIGPNPVRDQLSLAYYVDQSQALELRVVDLQGRTLINRNVTAMTGSNTLQLDMSGFADGFYSVQLKGAKGMLDQRVIKM